jgi:hypothetical protein
LRRDQTALSERVGALEDRVTAAEGRITAVEGRVTALEANAFSISGSITLKYNVARVWNGATGAANAAANDFDVDRLGFAGVVFAGGNTGTADFGTGLGTNSNGQVQPVFGGATIRSEGFVDADFSLTFKFNPRKLIEASKEWQVINPSFTVTLATNNGSDYNANGKTFDPVNFKLSSIDARFTVGNAPLKITFGIAPAFQFNNYAFRNPDGRGDGFVAVLDGASLLPLNPVLTIVYGSKNGNGEAASASTVVYATAGNINTGAVTRLVVAANDTTYIRFDATKLPTSSSNKWKVTVTYSDGSTNDGTYNSADGTGFTVGSKTGVVSSIAVQPLSFASSANGNNGDFRYYTAVRGELSLIPGFKGGVYYGYEGQDQARTVGEPVRTNTTAYGLDFNGALFGLINLNGEYNVSQVDSGPGGVAAFVNGGIKLDPFSISGNWRSIDSWYNGIANKGVNDGPYKSTQVGFGVEVAISKLGGFLDAGVYYDTRSNTKGGADVKVGGGPRAGYAGDFSGTETGATSEVNFGFKLGFRLIGLDITGTYDVGNENTGAVNNIDQRRFQVRADHDGSKADALIGKLNLSFGYRVDVNNTKVQNVNTIWAYADTSIGFGGIEIAPKAYFSSVSADAPGGDAITNYGGNVKITSAFLFGSKITLAAALDQSQHTAGFTASTGWVLAGLQWDVGIFGAPSNFGIQFASRTDANRNGTKFGPSFADPIGSGSWGGDGVGNGGNLSGLYFNFGYYGLNFGYGIFALTNFASPTNPTWGQRFQITYALKF